MVGAYSVVCWLKSSLKRIMNKNQFGFQNQFLGHQHQFIQSKMFSLKLKFTLYCNESIHTTEPNTQLFQGETKKKKRKQISFAVLGNIKRIKPHFGSPSIHLQSTPVFLNILANMPVRCYR